MGTPLRHRPAGPRYVPPRDPWHAHLADDRLCGGLCLRHHRHGAGVDRRLFRQDGRHGDHAADGYFAGVLPHQKQEKVKELQARGEFVAMVGDGINDAPALAQSDVGIAIGSGTDIAAETADIILVNSNPRDIASLVLFGKATYKKMVQNLAWATGYNVVAIPLAAGVLASSGILLSPALGAIFMSLSTVIVAINAKMLKVKK